MSYIINNSRGNIVAIVPDGTTNTTACPITLVGQGVIGYGTAENTNYVWIAENFAKGSPPLAPLQGQLWYNTTTDTISSYSTSNTWVALATQSYVQDQKVSPEFTGTPTAPTAANGTSTTQIATTAFVINQLQGAGPIITTGNITGGNISTTGTISASGNVYGANFIGNLVVGGSNTQVMFNDDGIANATTGFTFDKATGAVGVTGTLNAGTVSAGTITASNFFRLPNLSQSQINALSAQNGAMVYNTTTGLPQVYQNGAWKNFTISYYS